MRELIYFLQETGLYEYAENNNLILNDIPSDKLINAWNKHINYNDTDNIPKEDISESKDEHELLTLLRIEGKIATSNKFMRLAEIPFRIKTDNNSSYTVKVCSAEARNELASLIKSKDINRLIDCVKQYYNDKTLYRKTFSNLILSGEIQVLYDEYDKDGNSFSGIVPKFRIG